MQTLRKGQFFGDTNRRLTMGALTVTDTEYTHEKVDWHYHENPYFTFLLQGKMLEGNRKETYHCSTGTLLFHNWDDAHYNLKPPGFTRGFHIEIEQQWFEQYAMDTVNLEGSLNIKSPDVKLLFYKLFQESFYQNTNDPLAIEMLLLDVFTKIQQFQKLTLDNHPHWLKPLKELLHEESHDSLSLSYLSELFGVHPVHLSRSFPKYFGCTIGEYMRKIKVEKSLTLLPNPQKSLVEVALDAGFSDQSHFNRCFKTQMGITPNTYRQYFLIS